MSLSPAPFEVLETPEGFTWHLIGSTGRVLAYSRDIYPTDFAAADAAKAARARFDERARLADGRMILR